MNTKRSQALDALRGYAIMTMILSATEAFQILPRWMYHAQVPPPDHVFNPTIFGITWVDLIFPFFLFSMGAAFPLSLKKQLMNGATKVQLVWKTLLRFLRLAFFSVFCIHMYPFMMGYSLPWMNYVVPMIAFGWMCVMFIPLKVPGSKFQVPGFRLEVSWLKLGAYLLALAWMLLQPYSTGKPFSPNDNDIIIMILANVALVGSIIYIYTVDRPWVRMSLMPLIVALFLSASTKGSWQAALHDFTPLPWLYHFGWMEYLLIIIPGTVAGEMIAPRPPKGEGKTPSDSPIMGRKGMNIMGGAISLLIIVVNVVCLYNRWLLVNLILSVALIAVLMWVQRGIGGLDRNLAKMGSYLLVLGLLIEAFEGGIRKDDVTMSYMFVMAALAFFALLLLTVLCDRLQVKAISLPLTMVGRNPMVAYVICSMVVTPLLCLLRIYPLLDAMCTNPWLGFLKGVILTGISMAVTALFTYKKWYWKT